MTAEEAARRREELLFTGDDRLEKWVREAAAKAIERREELTGPDIAFPGPRRDYGWATIRVPRPRFGDFAEQLVVEEQIREQWAALTVPSAK